MMSARSSNTARRCSTCLTHHGKPGWKPAAGQKALVEVAPYFLQLPEDDGLASPALDTTSISACTSVCRLGDNNQTSRLCSAMHTQHVTGQAAKHNHYKLLCLTCVLVNNEPQAQCNPLLRSSIFRVQWNIPMTPEYTTSQQRNALRVWLGRPPQ